MPCTVSYGPGSNTPETDQIAAITTLFNPAGFRSLIKNYRVFAREWRRTGIPLFTVELILPGKTPEIPAGPNIFHVNVRSPLFHKETAINFAATRLPEKFNKIAWVDCDFVWHDYGWAEGLPDLLSRYPVAQLWRYLYDTDRHGNRQGRTHAFAFNQCKGRPGGAWAADRILFNRFGGLIDSWVTGGSDTLAACAFLGPSSRRHWQPCIDRLPPTLAAEFERWQQPVSSWVAGRVASVDSTADHLWHGDREHRQYGTRHRPWEGVDTSTILRRDANGFWEFSGPTKLERTMWEFFHRRREDG